MRNRDRGTGELLELLRAKPELVSALVFDTGNVKRLLKSKAGRRLVPGVDTRAFLRSVAGPAGVRVACNALPFATRTLASPGPIHSAPSVRPRSTSNGRCSVLVSGSARVTVTPRV